VLVQKNPQNEIHNPIKPKPAGLHIKTGFLNPII